jgi:hypothetical protein
MCCTFQTFPNPPFPIMFRYWYAFFFRNSYENYSFCPSPRRELALSGVFFSGTCLLPLPCFCKDLSSREEMRLAKPSRYS